MDEDGLQLGAEVKILAAVGNVERLDANTIARQHKPASGTRPDGDGKHAPQPLEAPSVPLEKRVQHGFGVAVAVELVPGFHQLRTQLQMVVNFAVEDDDGIAIVRANWLIAGL